MCALLLAGVAACSVDTAPDPAIPLRCGPGGQCLPGFVCAASGDCRAGVSAEDDAFSTDEDSVLSVLATQGVLANDAHLPGDTLRAEVVAGPEHGTLSLGADGAFTYTPAMDYAGMDAFTYRALAGQTPSSTATVRLTVRPKPDAPRTEPDAYSTDEDTPLVVAAEQGVLINDREPDGDALTAATDQPPAHGTLTLAPSGAFTYTPAPNWNGTDTFRYLATDGVLASAPTTVTLTVRPRNDAPTAREAHFRMAAGSVLEVPFWLGLLLDASDVEESALTVSLVTAPSQGELALRPDGSFTYAPPATFNGEVRFTYRVSDGELTSSPATVIVTVQPPPGLPIYLASIGTTGQGLSSSGDNLAFSGDGSLVVFNSTASNFVAGDTGNSDVFVNDRSGLRRISNTRGGAEPDGPSNGVAVSFDGRFIAFDSLATNLVSGDTNDARDIFLHDRQSGTTTRVSLGNTGAQANGLSAAPALSADGRFVAFTSTATNLTDTPPLGASDIYVRDLQLGTTTRASVRSGGGVTSAASSSPSLSADGRYVAFAADGAGLVDGDTNGNRDVFVHDRQTMTTVRASVSSAGVQGDRDSRTPTLSADGSSLAFESSATNLVPGDTNNATDVFVRDLKAGTTRRISVSATGEESNGVSGLSTGALSGDGQQVVFRSLASNLVPGDTNGFEDVFVADLRTGAIRRVSVSPAGAQLDALSGVPAVLNHDGSYVAFRTRANIDPRDTAFRSDIYVAPNPPPRVLDLVTLTPERAAADSPTQNRAAVSHDGRFVAFDSAATNLVAHDTNTVRDVFVRDLTLGLTERVSVPASGGESNGASQSPALSPDGRFVAFSSAASNLVAGDTNGTSDVFLRDRERGLTTRLSVGAADAQANGPSETPAACGLGACVVFASRATNLTPGTTAERSRIYLRDVRAGTTALISQGFGGADPDGDSSEPTVSGDGRFVAFLSSATNLTRGDTNGWPDAFVYDRTLGTTTRVSVSTDGREGTSPCEAPVISADGRFVAFQTRSNLVVPDGEGRLDVFVHDRQAHTTTRVSNRIGGSASNRDSRDPWLSSDGRFVVFTSAVTDLVAGDTNAVDDVFVVDRQTSLTTRVSQSVYGEGNGASSAPTISGDASRVVFATSATNLVPGDVNGFVDLVLTRNPGL